MAGSNPTSMTRPLALPRSRSTTELGSSTPAWIPFNEDRRTGSAASPAASAGSKKRPPSAASRSTLPQARYALRVDDSRNESLRTCVAKMAMVPIIKPNTTTADWPGRRTASRSASRPKSGRRIASTRSAAYTRTKIAITTEARFISSRRHARVQSSSRRASTAGRRAARRAGGIVTASTER